MTMRAAAFTAALSLAACATTRSPPAEAPSGPPVFPDGLHVKATGTPGQAAAARYTRLDAKVRAVDVAARSVTVETGDGASETIKVDAQVANLGALKAGDVLHIDYAQGLSLEYQPAGSAAVPLEIATTEDLAGGSAAAVIQATVTVTAIDRATRTIQFKGPRGNLYKVTAGPKVQLDRLEVGDRLLARYTEAFAVRLEKVGASI
jgi:hypothetical protein